MRLSEYTCCSCYYQDFLISLGLQIIFSRESQTICHYCCCPLVAQAPGSHQKKQRGVTPAVEQDAATATARGRTHGSRNVRAKRRDRRGAICYRSVGRRKKITSSNLGIKIKNLWVAEKFKFEELSSEAEPLTGQQKWTLTCEWPVSVSLETVLLATVPCLQRGSIPQAHLRLIHEASPLLSLFLKSVCSS